MVPFKTAVLSVTALAFSVIIFGVDAISTFLVLEPKGEKGLTLPGVIESILTALFFKDIKDLSENKLVSIFIFFKELKAERKAVSEDLFSEEDKEENAADIKPVELDKELAFATFGKYKEDKYTTDTNNVVINIIMDLLDFFFILF
jgi:hypothetical protein